MKKRFSLLSLAIATFFLLTTGPAYAYIDMGTGSMVFQMLVGGFIGLLFTIKTYWLSLKLKVRTFFSKSAGQDKTTDRKSKK